MTYPTLSQAVAAEIRAQVARHRFTLGSIAESAQIPLSTLQRRLNGDGRLTVDEVAAIAIALGISPMELLPESDAA